MKNFLIALLALSPLTAFAAEAPPAGFDFGMLILLGGMMIFMYFFMWRPQSKRAKEHKELVSSLSKNDEVQTTAGIIGKVTKVTDDYVTVEVSEKVEMIFQKAHVSQTLPNGTIKGIK